MADVVASSAARVAAPMPAWAAQIRVHRPIHNLPAAALVCDMRDWRVTTRELQDILYVAQALFIGGHEGIGGNGPDEPLIKEDFYAWGIGPVLPEVWHSTEQWGDGRITPTMHLHPDMLPDDWDERPLYKALYQINKYLKTIPAAQLARVTRAQGGAWRRRRNGSAAAGGRYIPKQYIFEEYQYRTSRKSPEAVSQ